MLKWKLLAILGLVFGIAGVSWGVVQHKKAGGFFELRMYTAQPGKRDTLAARFGLTKDTRSIFGMQPVGFESQF